MKFRADIEGLRGLAILMAISFHLGVPYLEGGFVSVDFFFVISGFLITSLLAGEFAKGEAVSAGSGTLSLKRFYYRRVRRILPVAVVILLITVCAGYLLFNPLRSKMILYNALWALFFCANINAIQQAIDYFQEGLPTSPLLHYWSLAVEEQFYFFWPLLFLLSARNSFKLPLLRRLTWERRVFLVISVIGVASYCWSIYATQQNSRGAYFSTLTRTFELATGAVVAMLVRTTTTISPRIKLACSVVAIGLIVTTTLTFSGMRNFPGYLGFFPTLATALYIIGGVPSADAKAPLPNRFLSRDPWRSLGTISYSMYLWHFPVILALRDTNPMVGKTGISMALILLAILVLSILSFFLIEKPCRIVSPHHEIATIFDPLFKGSVFKRVTVTMSGLALVAGILFLVIEESKRAVAATRQHNTETHTPSPASPAAVGLLPTLPSEEKILQSWRDEVMKGLSLRFLPAELIPLQPHLEMPLGLVPPCHDIWNPRYPIEHLEECASGDVDAPRKIAIVGDSRAGAWTQALRGALDEKKWRLYPLTRGHSCGWSYRNTGAPAEFDCPGLFDETIRVLGELHPDVLILTEVGFGDRTIFKKMLEQYLPLADKVIIISNLQGLPTFAQCLSKDNSIDSCSGTLFDNHGAELRLGIDGRATLLDVTELFCHNRQCPAIIQNTPVYYDGNHFSREMADKLSPMLRIFLRRAGVE
jgi:peptidoglycan/LPS O-acetylase OafA/YrhL